MKNGLPAPKPIQFFKDALVTLVQSPVTSNDRYYHTFLYQIRNMYRQPFEQMASVNIVISKNGSVTLSHASVDSNGELVYDYDTPSVYMTPEVADAVIEFLESHRDEIGVQVAAEAEKAEQATQDAD